MTRHEGRHPHQSEKLPFLPKEYVPYFRDADGKKNWNTITIENGKLTVVIQKTMPQFGGYLTREPIYGSPTYCPNATRLHKQHLREIGTTPHLVFFASKEAAEQAGFRRCQKCNGEVA